MVFAAFILPPTSTIVTGPTTKHLQNIIQQPPDFKVVMSSFLVYTKHTIEYNGQKVTFISHHTVKPTPTLCQILPHALWHTLA